MATLIPLRVGYVVKRYPRFSETFIVNEILAHEAAGQEIEIFSLYPPNDTHFQDGIARVRAPVTYLTPEATRASDFWIQLQKGADRFPSLWAELGSARGCEARELMQALALVGLVEARGLGHLHAHFGSTATEVVRLAARFTKIGFTFTAHAKDIFHESVARESLERKLREASAVVTVSDYNVSYLKKEFGSAADRVVRIYNGLDLDRFAYSSPADRRPVIAAVGRLIEKKGFEDLLAACAILDQRGIDFQCHIIGTGERETALKAQGDTLGLQSKITFAGARPQNEVISLVRQAAVFAAPCVVGGDGNADGLPTVLLEAMALGTPCVATPVTGIPDAIHHLKTGLIVPEHDPQALAGALEQLLHNAALRVKLATHARQLVEREFEIHRNAARLRELFKAASAQAA